MAKVQQVCLDEVVGYFDELEDPRSTINLKHPLVSVVVIAMMAVLAGAGGPTAIAKWAVCLYRPRIRNSSCIRFSKNIFDNA